MTTVSKAIKDALKAKDRGIASGEQAMKAILKDLHGQIMGELGKAALGSWDAYRRKQILDAIEFQMAGHTGEAKGALNGLLDTAWGLGKAVVDGPLEAGGLYSGYHLPTTLLDSLKEYSSDYLDKLFNDAWYQVKGEITRGIVTGTSAQDVAKAIGKTIDSGKFSSIAGRAETIARHEMGSIYSQAAQLRMKQAMEFVPGLEKQWRHAGHPRMPRPTHLAADGDHVSVDKPFIVGGVPMMFPRDPDVDLKETMHCGCDSVPYLAAWH